MIIPHEDPDSDRDATGSIIYPKSHILTWADFHPNCEAPPTTQQDLHWKHVASTIQSLRTSFAQSTSKRGTPRCGSSDRTAVLSVYQEALSKIEHASDLDARKLHLETVRKVGTILDLRAAEPSDAVFAAAGKNALLSPLDPHYAQPRLHYFDRGTKTADDCFYYAGWQRLCEWRRDGWPGAYPARAVERERRTRSARRRGKKALLRETGSEGLARALGADPVEWGDEVDADPARPWK